MHRESRPDRPPGLYFGGFFSVRRLIRPLLIAGLMLSGVSLSPLEAASAAGAAASSGASPSGAASSSSSAPSSTSPSGSSQAPSGSSAASSSSGSSTASPSGSATSSPSGGRSTSAGTRRVAGPAPQVTITATPPNPATNGTSTFSYESDVPTSSGVQFRCRLAGNGRSAAFNEHCPITSAPADTAKGTITISGLRGSRAIYMFSVQAYYPAVASPATPEVAGSSADYRYRIFTVYSRDGYLPPAGMRGNNPLAGRVSQRRNLTHVIRTLNAMPGYREAFPGLCPAQVPGTVRVSLYSMTDGPVAKALIAASRRCISVRVLMNDHLTPATDPAWRLLEQGLGRAVFDRNHQFNRSFAHRCSRGCRGGGVLHTKMYLFNATTPIAARNKIQNTVMVGSSNMTSNAAQVQWNDLYTVRNRPVLYSQFSNMFNSMARDSGFRRTGVTYQDGPYETTFWPRSKNATDPYLAALRSVRCGGVSGGAGLNGRTVVYVNMHAWFGTRGLVLARQVRQLYNQGCYVKVLYSFMSYGVFKILRRGAGASRMVVRRTLFSHNGRTGYVYSHYKNIAVSGNVRGNGAARVAWTGSNNFTDEGTRFDEVMMRIASVSAFNSYRAQFNYMLRRKSSPVYASYYEPKGGGRAP